MRAFVLAALLVLLTACAERHLIRETYLGQSLLEPDRPVKPVKRDGNGNPILPDKR